MHFDFDAQRPGLNVSTPGQRRGLGEEGITIRLENGLPRDATCLDTLLKERMAPLPLLRWKQREDLGLEQRTGMARTDVDGDERPCIMSWSSLALIQYILDHHLSLVIHMVVRQAR